MGTSRNGQRGNARPGPSRGACLWTPEERARMGDGVPRLGEKTCDVYLNDRAFWCNVPAAVWSYKLGGYQVLKKWLSYRERAILGRPLSDNGRNPVLHRYRSKTDRGDHNVQSRRTRRAGPGSAASRFNGEKPGKKKLATENLSDAPGATHRGNVSHIGRSFCRVHRSRGSQASWIHLLRKQGRRLVVLSHCYY